MGTTVGTRLTAIICGRWSAWLVLLTMAAFSALVIGFAGDPRTGNDPTGALPDTAESAQVAELRRQLPGGQVNPALVVYSRDGQPLTAADDVAIAADREAFAREAVGEVSPPVYAPDRTAALVAVPLPAEIDPVALGDIVDRLRAQARADLPAGATAQLTGGAGFTADVAAAFDGANFTLLAATVAVVAALLLVTYRSPWLWLVPLAVVGTADVVSNGLIAIVSRAIDLRIDASTTGIVDVLVFGAGTNYALLLIARYREELRRVPDRRQALRRALSSAGPAITASAMTVVLSLLTLLAAVLANDRAIGVAGAVGITTAMVYGLVVLPAALSVCGRGLFWPFIPRPGQPDPTRTGLWARAGNLVSRRPRTVLAGSLLLLAVLATGLLDARLGLSKTEQFRVSAESIDGLATLSRSFPSGTADPVIVVADAARTPAVLAAVESVDGVASARPAGGDDDLAVIEVVLEAEPDSTESYQAITELRTALDAVPEADALVGGSVATNLDTRDAALRDLRVVVPLVLVVVLAVLILLLRSIVAPLILVGTVVATFFAALGAATTLFTQVLGYPALDTSVPLLSFLFLVALGVDYNIFLTTRAREEAPVEGTRQGMRTALAVTGGVITSAGILLAAVFAVLGVLPLVTLTEIGIIVGFGVLLDTLLVRTLLVPAIAMVLGRRFWWPSALARRPDPEPAAAGGGAGPEPASTSVGAGAQPAAASVSADPMPGRHADTGG
ncbi:MMPL family transporter [Solwaraspora sp. WMMA2056]|uniref:MMPL family transporter n=1 Tax=Solwaraspora sp. WMMA2056 TaxID=3015161 RepID=UPI00259B168B|nr:MMPL family transporter [Solwaraspora sp. WMMA2056]WJK38296.1 MMPL family transporter [Solwaraspora sp. WMMA2056]